MIIEEPGILSDSEIEDLRKSIPDWNMVNLHQFTRRLNKILKQDDIQALYDYAARGYQALRRWQVLQLPYSTHFPTPTLPLDNNKYLIPYQVDSCDWRWDLGRGRNPLFYDYCCHGACHWLSLANLEVAKRLFPEIDWVILSNTFHTSVASLEHRLLFDLNYTALSVSAESAVEMLVKPDTNGDVITEMFNDELPYSFEELAVTGAAIEFWGIVDGMDKTDDEKLAVITEAQQMGRPVITAETTISSGAKGKVVRTLNALHTFED